MDLHIWAGGRSGSLSWTHDPILGLGAGRDMQWLLRTPCHLGGTWDLTSQAFLESTSKDREKAPPAGHGHLGGSATEQAAGTAGRNSEALALDPAQCGREGDSSDGTEDPVWQPPLQGHGVVPAGSEDTGRVGPPQSWPGWSQVFLGGLQLGGQHGQEGRIPQLVSWALGGPQSCACHSGMGHRTSRIFRKWEVVRTHRDLTQAERV